MATSNNITQIQPRLEVHEAIMFMHEANLECNAEVAVGQYLAVRKELARHNIDDPTGHIAATLAASVVVRPTQESPFDE